MDFKAIVEQLRLFFTLENLQQLISLDVARQAGAFAGAFVIAYLPLAIIRVVLTRSERRLLRIDILADQTWISDIFKLIKSGLHPLLTWLLAFSASRVFEGQEWATDTLAWLIPLLPIWLFYRLVRTGVSIWAPEARRYWINRRIVFPLALLAVFLHALGLLDDVLTYQNEIIQAVIVGLIYLVSSTPVEFVQRLLEQLQERLVHLVIVKIVPLVKNLVPILQSGLRPLVAYVLGLIVIGVFDGLNAGTNVLNWAVPFFLIWFTYEVIRSFLTLSLSEQRATQFNRILMLIAIGVAILHAIGQLARLWQLGLVELGENASLQLGALFIGLLIIFVSFRLSGTVRPFLRETLPQTGMNLSLSQILATLVGATIVVVGILTALRQMNIDLTTLTVIVGGLSVGLGFALQDIIANFLAGFILLFEGSIGVGDVIEVEGESGTVTEVGIRAVRIRTQDNIELIVPNAQFLTGTVTNFSSQDSKIRVHIPIGVTSNADPHQAKAAIERGLSHPLVLEDPPPAVDYLGPSSDNHDFDILVWTADKRNEPAVMSDIRMQVWDELVKDDIGMPLPGLDLFIK